MISAASVGFTKRMDTVAENTRKAKVCVVVDNPTNDRCLVDFAFDINLSVMDGDGGNFPQDCSQFGENHAKFLSPQKSIPLQCIPQTMGRIQQS